VQFITKTVPPAQVGARSVQEVYTTVWNGATTSALRQHMTVKQRPLRKKRLVQYTKKTEALARAGENFVRTLGLTSSNES